MKVALYTRVSTQEQSEKGLSIPDQVAQLEAHCKIHDHDIIAVYREEGASGTSDNRPEFQKMIEAIESGDLDVNAVMVLTTSRLFRNVRLYLEYELRLSALGIKIVSMTQDLGVEDTPDSELMNIFFAAMDQRESRNIAYHTARGMKENARQGYFNGAAPPFGYATKECVNENGKPKKRLVIDPDEAKVVERIFLLYTSDCLGSVEIAKRLNNDKARSRWKSGWTGKKVLNILQDTVYIGEHVFNKFDRRRKQERPEKEWVTVKVPPIICEEVFEAAAMLRKTKSSTRGKGRTGSGEPLLTGLLKCGVCGASMVSSIVHKTGKDGEKIKYPYYVCKSYKQQGKDACPGHRLPMKAVEEVIIGEVADKAFSKANVVSIMKEARCSLLEAERPVRAIRKSLGEVEKKIQRYYEAFESGNMDPALVAKRLELHQAEEKKLKAELKRRTAITELPAHIGSDENIARVQRELRSLIKTSAPGQIREYLRIILDKIIVKGYDIEIHGYTAGVMATLAVNKDDNEQGVTRVSVEVDKWQPVGDSNPCDGTENPGDTFSNDSNSNTLQRNFSEGTPECTQADTKNAHFEGIRGMLAGLSRDELIHLLADMLAAKADGGEGARE